MRSMKTGLSCMLAVLLSAAAGCGGDSRADGSVASDSAGIRIVQSTSQQWEPGAEWSLGAEPLVEIGVVEGAPEFLFSTVAGGLLLDDGRIAIADRGSAQVRFFRRDGTFERYVGGPGQGPGELEYIRGLGQCGADSLYVFDLDWRNVVFANDGAYARAARPYDANNPTLRPYSLRCSKSGHYAAIGWEPRVANSQPGGQAQIGFYRAESPAWILSPSHENTAGAENITDAGLFVSAQLGTFLSSERIGTPNGSGPHPFGRATRFAVLDDGVLLGTGEAYEIRKFSMTGNLERIIRWQGDDLAITEDVLAAYSAERLADATPENRPRIETQLRDMPPAVALPAFTQLEIDPSGNIWVKSFKRPGAAAQQWTILDRDGALLGRVTFPTELEILDIGDDVVLTLVKDELGVERIRLYPLAKTATVQKDN